MKKQLRCSDVIPGCDFVARGINDNEVIVRAARHVFAEHDMRELTPEVQRRMIEAIRDAGREGSQD